VRVAVIGDGLLGRSLFEAAPGGTVLLTHANVDITSPSSLDAMLRQHRPDVVINTAALHQLGACEADPQRAFNLNALAAERLARTLPTVYVSTDYVFNEKGPHTEVMPGQQPRSVYGRSKLAGEIATLEYGGIVVRVSGLYGHYRSHKGPTFPESMLSSFAPIKLPTDQHFSPTYAPDAAERILMLASYQANQPGMFTGIYHAANRGTTCWAEWGEQIANYVQHRRHVIPYRAKDPLRPTDSTLKSTRMVQLPHYLDAFGRWAQRERKVEFPSPLRES
jgi:dTDP-4-dehydrorhamnose reductase